jgi:hypothetical protein
MKELVMTALVLSGGTSLLMLFQAHYLQRRNRPGVALVALCFCLLSTALALWLVNALLTDDFTGPL